MAYSWNDFLTEILAFNLDSGAIERLKKYHDMIIEKSKVMNLLSAKGLENILIDHFYDSLVAISTFQKIITQNKYETIADMGSGNGIPGVVLQIVFPDKKVFLLESIKKKADFLKEVYGVLGFDTDQIICERVEKISSKNKFDIVTARGLGEVKLLVEYGVTIMKKNGRLIFFKSVGLEEEIKNTQTALKKNNLKIEGIVDISHHEKQRNLLLIS
jgi:16S rRNA (guanine527-N7)-methyltransferase